MKVKIRHALLQLLKNSLSKQKFLLMVFAFIPAVFNESTQNGALEAYSSHEGISRSLQQLGRVIESSRSELRSIPTELTTASPPEDGSASIAAEASLSSAKSELRQDSKSQVEKPDRRW